MGSFNETCALSNLSISPGTSVRLLFLTQNPYVISDNRYAQRGCYHNDQWFSRTPPIKGEYSDYGNCEFEENSITKLIVEVFQKDVVEKPFGFNQYHTVDVTKGKDIHHLLTAAFEGRLSVSEESSKSPKEFPTWKIIHDILRKASLPILIDFDYSYEAYNAQPVIPGVVVVNFNSYGKNLPKLKIAQKLLSEEYDCKIVYKKHKSGGKIHKTDPCLIVTVKGGVKNTSLISKNLLDIKKTLNTHPEYTNSNRDLPVLAVMIREDVWKAYYNNSSIKNDLQKIKDISLLERYYLSIPFQTTIIEHLKIALSNPNFVDKNDLLQSCIELISIESLMMKLSHSWYIPPFGGQESYSELHTKLISDILDISKKESENDLLLYSE